MDAAFGIYTRHFWKLAKLAAAVWIPLAIVLILVDIYRFTEVNTGELYFVGDTIRSLDHGRLVAGGIAVGVVYTVGSLILVGASLRAASQAYMGEEPEVGPSLRFAAGKLLSMFWLAILLVVLLAIGFLLIVVPGIYLAIAWILAMPVLLFEGKGAFKSMGRSFDLIRHHWWRTFGIVIVIGIFSAILGDVIPGVISGLFDGVSKDHFTLWIVLTDAIAALGPIVTTGIWAATIAVIYYDMRVRKEGFDVEMMAGRLDAPGGLAPETFPQRDPYSTHPPGDDQSSFGSAPPPPPPPPPPPAPPTSE
jgi:hypothetical protein